MKIIFDSEEQKDKFKIIFPILAHELCPIDIGIQNNYKCRYRNFSSNDGCLTCWRNCGIEMEVRDKNEMCS